MHDREEGRPDFIEPIKPRPVGAHRDDDGKETEGRRHQEEAEREEQEHGRTSVSREAGRAFGQGRREEDDERDERQWSRGMSYERGRPFGWSREEEEAGFRTTHESGTGSAREDEDRTHDGRLPLVAHRHRRDEEIGDRAEEPIPDRLEDFVAKLEEEVGYKKSFDVVVREMTFGDKRTALFFMNGFAKDQVLTEVLKRLTYLHPDDLSADALESFFHLYVPAVQVTKESDWNTMMTGVLAGTSALYLDGERSLLLIDAKNFPSRSPEEPSLERVVRGARDGFVETMLVNVTLVRRRLRDKHLRYEVTRVGDRTQMDVCIAYIDDIADMELVESVRDKIKMVKVDGFPLADKQLEEATVKRGWNPFPLVRYSERPDTVASHLMEGHVAVFVDTSPSVMMLPTTFFDLVQHAEENRQTPFMGTYLRWVRFFGIWASLFLLPMWFLFALKPELKPPFLEFLGVQKPSRLPLVLQFIMAEVGVDLLRMAAVHTPTPLATAMSLIAAILIGDIAVKTGLFVNEVILYMSVAAIGMFATPSYELGLANRIVRLLLIIAVSIWQIPGFVLVSTLIFIILVMQRSFNRPYMWPLIPFDANGLRSIVIRPPVLHNRTRPANLKAQQKYKMPNTDNEDGS